MALQTPILLIAFNRPSETVQVFEAIRKMQPTRLYIAADAPRPNREDDVKLCQEVKSIVSKIDWPCSVKHLYQEKNLGCRFGPVAAMDWFFENEEQGIVLEDDCLPNEDFFPFCEEMLELYKNDERIFAICGRNPLGKYDINKSYFFSRTFKEWGWASWRRAWKHNKIDAETFDAASNENIFARLFEDEKMAHFLHTTNKSVHYEKHVAWDYVWQFNIFSQHGLVIVPAVNLVKNIGLNSGTHFGVDTKIVRKVFDVGTYNLTFPLKHPSFIFADHIYDHRCFYTIHPYFLPKQYSLIERIKDSVTYRAKKLFGLGK